jgi:hypothetical protein
MTGPDYDLVDARLKDLARQVSRGVATPPYSGVEARARRRRYTRALTLTCTAVLAAVGIALVLRPGTELARPRPVVTPTPTPSTGRALPLAENAQVTDLFELAAGRLAVLYGQCARPADLCVPRFYLSDDGGRTWTKRYEFDGSTGPLIATESQASFVVSPAGDLALLTDAAAETAGADRGGVGVVVAGDDPKMSVHQAAAVGPRRAADIADPQHAIVLTATGGYQVLYRNLSTLVVSPLDGATANRFPFTGAVDGILSGKADNTHSAVSLDLGTTWLPLPPMPGTALGGAVMAQGNRLIRFGFDDFSGKPEIYPLAMIQVSEDRGRSWRSVEVRHGAGDTSVGTVVPLADGTFVGLTPDGRVAHGTAEGQFTEDASAPQGTVTALRGHGGQAWATTDHADIWIRDSTEPVWRKLHLPEQSTTSPTTP